MPESPAAWSSSSRTSLGGGEGGGGGGVMFAVGGEGGVMFAVGGEGGVMFAVGGEGGGGGDAIFADADEVVVWQLVPLYPASHPVHVHDGAIPRAAPPLMQ